MNKKTLSDAVINWYEKNHRRLPWRPLNNDNANPYHVFLSEFMLQQTLVKTVIPYFIKFVKKYSNIFELSNADLSEVLADWAGLGYYRRAKNLHESAKIISSQYKGKIPKKKELLLKLPGVGEYTASAILSIGFNIPENVVDGNVERIFCRLYKIPQPLDQVKNQVRKIASNHLPQKKVSFYVQGLMDIGSTICKPKTTNCNECPLRSFCRVVDSNKSSSYPMKNNKKIKQKRVGYFLCFVKEGNSILLVKNLNTGLYANMDVLPSYGWLGKNDKFYSFFSKHKKDGKEMLLNVFHSFTHFDLKARIFVIDDKDFNFNLIDFEHFFIKISDLKKKALPNLHLKIINLVFKNRMI